MARNIGAGGNEARTTSALGRHADQSIFLALRDGLVHWPSMGLITGATLVLAVQSPIGFISIDVKTVASSVFQVSGTMVALTLPAAQLSNALVSQMRELFPALKGIDHNKAKEAIDSIGVELEARISLAWRAVTYAFFSFMLASLALLMPAGRWPPKTKIAVSGDDLLVAAALASLVVGSFWFFPMARYLFGLQHLKIIRDTAEIIFGPMAQGDAPKQTTQVLHNDPPIESKPDGHGEQTMSSMSESHLKTPPNPGPQPDGTAGAAPRG